MSSIAVHMRWLRILLYKQKFRWKHARDDCKSKPKFGNDILKSN